MHWHFPATRCQLLKKRPEHTYMLRTLTLLYLTDSSFNTSGCNDWKHGLKASSHHENGQEHRKCMMTHYSHLNIPGCIDT
jgi:hypothetical protein